MCANISDGGAISGLTVHTLDTVITKKKSINYYVLYVAT